MDESGERDLTGRDVVLRRLDGRDDLGALTALLHRAYGRLAERGMRYLASHQDVETTRRRVEKGECWVAEVGGRVVGTVTLRDAEQTKGCAWYDRAEVASFGQFAVEPAWQGWGIGGMLMECVERRAREKGVVELALDTAEGAVELIRFYEGRGYRRVGFVSWGEVVNYRSVVMSKAVG